MRFKTCAYWASDSEFAKNCGLIFFGWWMQKESSVADYRPTKGGWVYLLFLHIHHHNAPHNRDKNVVPSRWKCMKDIWGLRIMLDYSIKTISCNRNCMNNLDWMITYLNTWSTIQKGVFACPTALWNWDYVGTDNFSNWNLYICETNNDKTVDVNKSEYKNHDLSGISINVMSSSSSSLTSSSNSLHHFLRDTPSGSSDGQTQQYVLSNNHKRTIFLMAF